MGVQPPKLNKVGSNEIDMKSTTIAWLEHCEHAVRGAFARAERIARHNQRRVLEAFWAEQVSAIDLQGSTGYGLDDLGRDKLERIYARVFGAEAALIRPQIISGTHALRLGLFAVCRPGDQIIFATGEPYDTLQAVVGLRAVPGSLGDWGVSAHVVPLLQDGRIDVESVIASSGPRTRLIMFQRSRGYAERPALSVETLAAAFAEVKRRCPGVLIGVDNCYGEFVEDREPTAIGADLAMGSLIKNPGAGIAPTGGYVVGRADIIEQAASQLYAPGLGGEMGPTHDLLRTFYQALFLAPHVVSQAVKASILAAYVFAELGLRVEPHWEQPRADLIVATEFGSSDRLLAFCRAVQACAPVDSHVRPEAGHMAGYADAVVMAAGTFMQGGSLELSADAPMRPPYIGYLQGGLTYEHAFLAIANIVDELQHLLDM